MMKVDKFSVKRLLIVITAIIAGLSLQSQVNGQSTAAEITAFNFDLPVTYTESINATAGTIAVQIYNTAPISTLVAKFILSTGATAKIGAVAQVSGTTVNDFTSAVTYVVTAEDGSTTKSWVVTVTKKPVSVEKELLSFEFPAVAGAVGVINPATQTVAVTVPWSTNVTTLVAKFSLSPLANATIGGVAQVSETTPNDFTSPVTYVVTAEDGTTTRDYVVTVTKLAASNSKQILTFSFPAITGAVGVINHTTWDITVTVPFSQNVTALIATFTLSPYATVTVGGVAQVSGTTPNDFTSQVVYEVKAEDGSTRNYYVNIVRAAASTEAKFTSFVFEAFDPDVVGTINETAKTITLTVPFGTNVTALVASFTSSAYSTVKIGTVVQTSAATANDFTAAQVYTVVAEDGTTSQNYTVTVTIAAASTANTLLTFSFAGLTPAVNGVIAQSAKTVTITVPFSTNLTALVATFTVSPFATVAIGGTAQTSGTTPNDFSTAKVYTVTSQSGATEDYTVTVTKTAASSAKDLYTFQFLQSKNPALGADFTGTISQTNKTVAVTLPFGSNVNSLIATFTNSALATVTVAAALQTSGVTANNFTTALVYRVTAEDATTKDYTVTVTVLGASRLNRLLTYSFTSLTPVVNGIINETAKAVAITVPWGTNLTALIASFTVSQYATVNIGGTPQVTGVTTNNFTNPVEYNVVAQDGSIEKYLVTVTVENEAVKKFLTFNFPNVGPGIVGTINENNQTVSVLFPNSASVLNQVAQFTMSPGVTAKIGGVDQTSGVTVNNFDVPRVYTLIGTDGSTTDWTVTVTNAPVQTLKSITSFRFNGLTPNIVGVIDEANHTISATVPLGTAVTALVATFTNSWMSTVTVAGTAQVSGTTPNDFSNAVVYRCTAEDASFLDYTVTVTVAPASSAKDLLTFGFLAANNPGVLASDVSGVIDQGNLTVRVTVPNGTVVTSMVASFTSSPLTTVRVTNQGIQNPGVTSLNFSAPVVYEIYAQDGSQKNYTVTLEEADDVTKPIVSNAAQTVNNTLGSFAIIRSNESTGKVYMILNGVTQVTIADLEAAVAAGNGRSGRVEVAGVDIPISTHNMKEGTYYAYATDAAGNLSIKGTNAIVVQDKLPPTVNVDAQTISNGPFNIVIVKSSDDTGFVYLIKEGVAQNTKQQLDIAVAAKNGAKGFVYAANTGINVSVQGLNPGNYTAYAVDMSDNMSAPSANLVVITEASRLKSMTSFSFQGTSPASIGHIAGDLIDIEVPYGTNLLNLVASFTISPLATAFVGLVQQVSGVTVNDFTNPVVYTVEAEDGSTIDYTVTVTVGPSGIGDILWSQAINVYPNPFNSSLQIVMETMVDRIVITDMVGHIILDIDNPKDSGIKLDTQDWSTGLFIIQFIKDGKQVNHRKLIHQ